MLLTILSFYIFIYFFLETNYKIICYLTNWSAYRYNNLLFPIQVLDSHLCTHLIYGFVTLDSQTFTIKSNDTFSKIDNG